MPGIDELTPSQHAELLAYVDMRLNGPEFAELHLFAAALASQPDLSTGLCVGRSPQFDDRIPGETDHQRRWRHLTRRRECQQCPVLDRCRQLVEDTPREVLSGVIAGRSFIDPKDSLRMYLTHWSCDPEHPDEQHQDDQISDPTKEAA